MKGVFHGCLTILATLTLLAGCNTNGPVRTPPGGGGNDNTSNQNTTGVNPQESGVAGLQRFRSDQEFREYFAGQVVAENDQFSTTPDSGANPPNGNANASPSTGSGGLAEGDGTAAPAPSAPGAEPPQDDRADNGDFSGTTLQEAGVDEADVVKSDGTYLYILSDGMLRIVRAVPAETLEEVGRFDVDGYGQDMYLFDGRAVVITTPDIVYPVLGGGGAEDADAGGVSDGVIGDFLGDFAPQFYRQQVEVSVIDVSNPQSPTMVTSIKFDGSVASSRMIDGILHLVVANYPNYFYDILPLGRPEAAEMVVSMESTVALPNFEMKAADGTVTSGDAVTVDNLFHPVDPDGFGMSLLISLDVRQPSTFQSLGIVANPGLIYSSTDALYVTDTQYSFLEASNRETTDIYKFAYTARGAELTAAGTVTGRILNQYSMSEYQGNLRVATMEEAFDRNGFRLTNHVFVLGERDGALSTIGRIDNISPGETIQSARFLGDKGYLVTFQQIDPLFTIDLSDATNPRVVGTLEVPGFSTFIVPLGETRLLTIGQGAGGFAAPPGVKLEIFDVSDFANPQSVASTTITASENGYAFSEAQYNPKAFNFYESPTQGNLLALPVRIENYTFADTHMEGDVVIVPSPTIELFDGLYVYRITDAGFDQIGRVSTVPPSFDNPYGYYSSFGRGVFIGDNVYAVTDRTVVASPLASVGTALSRVDFPFMFEIPPDFPPILPPIAPGDGTSGSSGSGEAGSGTTTPPSAP